MWSVGKTALQKKTTRRFCFVCFSTQTMCRYIYIGINILKDKSERKRSSQTRGIVGYMWKVCNNKMLSSLAEVYDLINILKKYVYYSPKKHGEKKRSSCPDGIVFLILKSNVLIVCSFTVHPYVQFTDSTYINEACRLASVWKLTCSFNFWIHNTQKKKISICFSSKSSHSCRTISKYVWFFPPSFKASPKRLQLTFMYNYRLTWKMLENVVKRSEFVYTRE